MPLGWPAPMPGSGSWFHGLVGPLLAGEHRQKSATSNKMQRIYYFSYISEVLSHSLLTQPSRREPRDPVTEKKFGAAAKRRWRVEILRLVWGHSYLQSLGVGTHCYSKTATVPWSCLTRLSSPVHPRQPCSGLLSRRSAIISWGVEIIKLLK